MNKNWLFVLILVVLVVAAGVQAVELQAMKKSISDSGLSFSSKGSGSTSGTASSTGSLDSLPQMVGGC